MYLSTVLHDFNIDIDIGQTTNSVKYGRHVKYLGIIIDFLLKWELHVNYLIIKFLL